MALCIICGTRREDEFTDTRDDFCERCKDLLDYWFNESYNDIKTVSAAELGKEITRKDFADAVEVYGNLKWREEHDRDQIRKKKQQRAAIGI